MIGLLAAMCAAVFNVLIADWILMPYTTPRVLFLSIAGFGLLASWLITGPVLFISGQAAQAALALLAVWAFCSFTAIRKDIALRHFVTFSFCVFFGLFLTPAADSTAVIMMLTGVATVSAAVAAAVNIGQREVFKTLRPRKMFEASGLVGNPNAHGAYLMIHAFLAAYLARYHHWIWTGALAIILCAIWRTRSRGAMVGIAAAGVFLAVLLLGAGNTLALAWGVMVCGWIVMIALKPKGSYERLRRLLDARTLRERRNYWRVAWRMINESPFFGIGFDNFSIRAPYVQRDLNRESGGEFLKRENYLEPWPELAHNDVLQALVDNGAVGMAMLVPIGILCFDAFTAGIGDPMTVFVSAAIVSFLAAGLTWHLSYLLPANMTIWCLLGIMLKQPEPWNAALDPLWIVLGMVLLGFLIWKYVIEHGAFQVLMARYFKTNKIELLKRALCIEPRSTRANLYATLYCWRNQKYETAYTHAIAALQHFDGSVPIWKLWTNLGNIFRQHGSLTLANAAFNEALSFLPWFDLAIIGREQLKGTLVRMETELKEEANGPSQKFDSQVDPQTAPA